MLKIGFVNMEIASYGRLLLNFRSYFHLHFLPNEDLNMLSRTLISPVSYATES